MMRLRERYGAGLLRVPLPGRLLVLVLSTADAARILRETLDPFSPPTTEKRRALAQLEPGVSLVPTGAGCAKRRHRSEGALGPGRTLYPMAGPFVAVADEEARRLLAEAGEAASRRASPGDRTQPRPRRSIR